MPIAPFCFCSLVSEKSLQALVEVNSGGSYKDNHPWLIAAEMLADAQRRQQRVALLLAAGSPPEWRRWAWISEIDVNRYSSGSETRVRFGPLTEVTEMWQPLDSLFVFPPAERVRREQLEGLRAHRDLLVEAQLHPYAICEAPPFLLAVSKRADDDAGGGETETI